MRGYRPIFRPLFFAAFALAGCTSSTSQTPPQVQAGVDQNGACTLTLNGKGTTAKELRLLLKKTKTREVRLTGANVDVPYRCIGATIYELQRSKIPVKFDFVSELPENSN